MTTLTNILNLGKLFSFATKKALSTAVVTLWIAGSAQAATLQVDFGTDPSLQSGFTAQGAVDAVYNLAGGVTVSVDVPVGSTLTVRGKTTAIPSSGSAFIADGTNILDLQDDHLFRSGSEGEFMDITISGAIGSIAFEGWFADTHGNSFSADQSLTVSTDGGSTFGAATIADASGFNASPTALAMIANGTDDVIVRITEFNTFNQVRLNGFAISTTAVPEPTGFALVSMALLLGAMFYRLRKRA